MDLRVLVRTVVNLDTRKNKIESRALLTTVRISHYEKPISLDPTFLDKNKRVIDKFASFA
jgi:hypothetical protein